MDSYLLSVSGLLRFTTTSGNYMDISLDDVTNALTFKSRDLGPLLSIVDSLDGSLFAATDSLGLPVLEAFSDGSVKAGRYGLNDFLISGGFTTIGTTPQTGAKLFVRGTNSAIPSMRVMQASSTQTGSIFQVEDSSNAALAWVVKTNSSGDLRVGTAGAYIRLAGNLGSGSPGISSTGTIDFGVDINGTGGSSVLGIRKSTSGTDIVRFKNTAGTTQSSVNGSGIFYAPGNNPALLDYSFYTDTDTGLNRIAVNTVALIASGATVATYTENGTKFARATYYPIRTVSGDYALTTSDSTLIQLASGSTITAPSGVIYSGILYNIKNASDNDIIISGASGVLIDSANTLTISTSSKLAIQHDGAQWWTIL